MPSIGGVIELWSKPLLREYIILVKRATRRYIIRSFDHGSIECRSAGCKQNSPWFVGQIRPVPIVRSKDAGPRLLDCLKPIPT